MLQDLLRCQADLAASISLIHFKSLGKQSKRSRFMVAAILALLAGTAAFVAFVIKNSRIQWARTEALPEITKLVDEGKPEAAYTLAEQAERYIPNNPSLVKVWGLVARNWTINTTPVDADVYRSAYDAKSAP